MNPDDRAAFRAFVRDHHPDRGGDPEAFVAGLARFRAASVPPTSGAGGTDAADIDPDDPRWEAPVEIVAPLPLPVRAAVALIRTVRWHRNRRVL